MASRPQTTAPFPLTDKALQERWQAWQPAGADTSAAPDKRRAVSLEDFDPSAKPFSGGSKSEDQASTQALAEALDGLQSRLFAQHKHKLLVVLQGTDTSGKDGTIRAVFGRMSALGVRAVGWRAPTAVEAAHDYLWRIHQQVPGAGEITVFNRSHYEDVLVPVVQGDITPAQQQQRFAQINDFERMLSETGTVVLKFLLHISADEQKQRLQSRLDTPDKRWKFDQSDITARGQWAQYQQAYSDLLTATHTAWAPWTIVPANSKTQRNLMIATLVHAVLTQLDPQYPPGDPALDGIRIE